MSQPATIVWFRRDLRLHDNPAWNWAVEQGGPIVPVYLHCPTDEGAWRRGGASTGWLHHALEDLAAQLASSGHRLVLRQSTDSHDALQKVIAETQAQSVCWNRCYEPTMVQRDSMLKQALQSVGIETQSFNGSLLLDPLTTRNKAGKPFQVFTPFWKHCRAIGVHPVETSPPPSARPTKSITSDRLDNLKLLPTIPWDTTIQETWKPTRQGGLELLDLAVRKSQSYLDTRDTPATDGTSRLSAYLHFGQISPREFFHHIWQHASDQELADTGILRQLYWREFSAHLLFHFPHSQDTALKPAYDHFPWAFNETYLRAWQLGQTGFPIVDAGMRQLWQTGWMHNRVRMIAGSFLVKHLLQPWQEGARWFWDTLCDADLANNSIGWQWIAGSGADASPYFRIFNPILQGQKFDPLGDYVHRWCPELAQLPKKNIHTPWDAPPDVLQSAKIKLGHHYPHPITSHQEGRNRALSAYTHYKEISRQL
ncbi:MAG: DNA photolyase family protein [Verrucomicrobiae bacterium]|nr:DNA photolyase family protein [Verrucomicrobiae bacterium]NNJ41854.1 deoxyribodipyrimidine photo-lyase [Akkermansiaceae bacterium]